MANKKISELVSRTPSLTDLMLVGDPSSGYSYKCTVNDIALQVEAAVAGNYVTLATAQTISGAKTFSNVLTLTSVANSAVDTDKFLVLTASNTVNYRTGAEVLSDIGGASASSISGTTNYIPKFTSSSAIGNSIIYESNGKIGIGTTAPNNKFVISNNGAAGIEFDPVVGSISTYNRSTSAYAPMLNYSSTQIWYIDTTERMRLEANGNFGINTSSPNEKLEVSGVVRVSRTTSASAYLNLTIENGVAGYDARGSIEQVFYTGALERIRIGLGGDVTLSTIANATTDTDKFLVSDGGVIKYRTGAELLSDIGGASGSSISGTTNYIPKFTSSSAIGNSAMYESGGSIGIGTITPQTLLELYSGTEANLRLHSGGAGGDQASIYVKKGAGNGLIFGEENRDFIWQTGAGSLTNGGGSERMRLDASGNLGIGTSSPTEKLTVNGNAILVGTATSSVTLGFGTANGVSGWSIGNGIIDNTHNFRLYDNTNGAVRLTVDNSGNLGLGVTPSAWSASYKAIQISSYASITQGGNDTYIGNNWYNDGTNKYLQTNAASLYGQSGGSHIWYNAPSGTAGNAISFTQVMTLDASGRLGIGTTSPTRTLTVYNTAAADAALIESNQVFSTLAFKSSTNASTVTVGIDGAGNAAFENKLTTGAMSFVTNGSERMRITSGGYLLLGTTTSAYGQAGRGTFEMNGTTDNILVQKVNNTLANYIFSDATKTEFYSTNFLQLSVNGSERMRITSGGLVYIGSSTGDGYRLQINGNTQALSTFGQTYIGVGAYSQWITSGGAFAMGLDAANGSTERMRITSGGELLINTTSDAGDYKLQVNGNGYFTGAEGNLYINSSSGSGKNWQFQSYTDGKLYINVSGVFSALSLDGTSGAAEFSSSIKTAAPSGGTAKPFKIGAAAVVSPTSPNRTIEIEIDGVTYYLSAKTTND